MRTISGVLALACLLTSCATAMLSNGNIVGIWTAQDIPDGPITSRIEFRQDGTFSYAETYIDSANGLTNPVSGTGTWTLSESMLSIQTPTVFAQKGPGVKLKIIELSATRFVFEDESGTKTAYKRTK